MQENAFENVVLKMAANLFHLQCVDLLTPGRFDLNFK